MVGSKINATEPSKEIGRIVMEGEPEKHDVDLSLLEHVSPITWENIILYGDW
jgi:hypothetical protein